MAESRDTSSVFVATQTAHVQIGEGHTRITKNVTRVRAGHELLDRYPGMFKPADEGVRFDVETRTDSEQAEREQAEQAEREQAEQASPGDHGRKRKGKG